MRNKHARLRKGIKSATHKAANQACKKSEQTPRNHRDSARCETSTPRAPLPARHAYGSRIKHATTASAAHITQRPHATFHKRTHAALHTRSTRKKSEHTPRKSLQLGAMRNDTPRAPTACTPRIRFTNQACDDGGRSARHTTPARDVSQTHARDVTHKLARKASTCRAIIATRHDAKRARSRAPTAGTSRIRFTNHTCDNGERSARHTTPHATFHNARTRRYTHTRLSLH